MNARYIHRNATHRCPKGIALIVALLVLVAMTVAAIGLMRSVDTSTSAIGNLSFRQAADEAARTALFAEIRTLEGVAHGAARDFFNTNGVFWGYYASIQPNENARGIPWLLQNRGNVGVALRGQDALGNQASVMIERMCRDNGPASLQNCSLGGAIGASGNLEPCWDANVNCGDLLATVGVPAALFRITVRIDGPRNVVSYAQSAIVLN
ncbi:MAG: hypothetical protein LBE75_00075 [Burkholderiales bacterium]|jgi:hypothetical protein|nr:hypothetical protein [Burkholderiales bacterium]